MSLLREIHFKKKVKRNSLSLKGTISNNLTKQPGSCDHKEVALTPADSGSTVVGRYS